MFGVQSGSFSRAGKAIFAGVCCALLFGCGQPEMTSENIAAETAVPEKIAKSASPEKAIGDITGSVGDINQTWKTIRISNPSGTHATANFSAPTEIMIDFNLQGHVGGKLQVKDSITVQFTLMNDRLVESGVKYFPSESTFPFYGDHKRSVQVTLESVDITGNTALIKGTVTGTIYKTVDFRTAPNTADALPVSLSFNTKVYKD